jgi:hypothetical protein
MTLKVWVLSPRFIGLTSNIYWRAQLVNCGWVRLFYHPVDHVAGSSHDSDESAENQSAGGGSYPEHGSA